MFVCLCGEVHIQFYFCLSFPSCLFQSVEKALIRPTAFKPVLPRSSSSSMETHNSLNQILGHGLSPSEQTKDTSEPKQDIGSGTLTDSGRNSMSSLPTHSTGCSSQLDGTSISTGNGTGTSTGASMGQLVRYSSSAHNVSLQHHLCGNSSGLSGGSGSAWPGDNSSGIGEMTVGSWMNSTSPSSQAAVNAQANTSTLSDSLVAAMNLNRDIAAAAVAACPSNGPLSLEFFSDTNITKTKVATPASEVGCVRSPISMDESLILQLERKLLERESELQELQVCLEDKEAETCHLFEEKQRYCAEEMQGLKQRCSTKLRQASQRALRAQQLLQLQVIQLQQDKEQLQEEVDRLEREREAAEGRLRSYEREKNQLAPTLEETQWEVRDERSADG